MAKNLMRRYNTQEEYDNELCYIPSDTLSIVIENNKVNYGVNVNEGSGYFVKLDGEKIDIGANVIPNSYNGNNTDIHSVEIGCGINKISSSAFRNCVNLHNIKYYGTTEPSCGNGVFEGNIITNVKVTKDYEGEYFCGLQIDRCL